MKMQMDIRFQKNGISNQPNVCIFDESCFSKFEPPRVMSASRKTICRTFVCPCGTRKSAHCLRCRDMHPSDCPNVEETRNPMQTFSRKKFSHFSQTNIPSAFPHEIPKCVSYNITYHSKAVYAYCDNSFDS